MTQYTTLTKHTMALLSLVSLHQAHLMVCHALQLAARLQLQVHGCVVDLVLFSASLDQMEALRHEVAKKLPPDGSAMLQVKDKRKTPGTAFAERVVAKKVSHWRSFTPCKGLDVSRARLGRLPAYCRTSARRKQVEE